jgi:hypothetical protein
MDADFSKRFVQACAEGADLFQIMTGTFDGARLVYDPSVVGFEVA